MEFLTPEYVNYYFYVKHKVKLFELIDLIQYKPTKSGESRGVSLKLTVSNK